MKTVIDDLTVSTGWVLSPGSSVSVQSWPELTASYLPTSLLFKMVTAGTATKLYSPAIPITALNTIGFSIKSDQDDQPVTAIDYRLKILFSDGTNTVEYYLSEFGQFSHNQYLNTLTSIASITITALQPVQFFMSEIIAYNDEFPFDIYSALVQMLRLKLDSLTQLQVGTVTAAIGDTQVTVVGHSYIDKYAAIKIGTEIHQIVSEVSEGIISFGEYFDGRALLNNYTNEPVYMYFPATFEDQEFDAFIPGIAMSEAWNSEVVGHDRYSSIIDSWNILDDTVRVREFGTTYEWTVLIEAMSRHSQIDELLMKGIKKAFNDKSRAYINGRPHEVHATKIEFVDYGDANEILSKTQLRVNLVIQEDVDEWEIQPVNFNLTQTIGLIQI